MSDFIEKTGNCLCRAVRISQKPRIQMLVPVTVECVENGVVGPL